MLVAVPSVHTNILLGTATQSALFWGVLMLVVLGKY